VGGGLRVDVFEGDDLVVFVDFFGGDFATEDAAEEAVGIGHFLFPRVHRGNDNIAAAGLSWASAAEGANPVRSLGHD
jgi:hypothetical protein